MKEFKTINQQIELLRQRGLIIKDDDKAKRYLLSQNYYNIINGYAHYFPHDNSDNYTNNTDFDEIAHLYIFEREIKQAILHAILGAEGHLKAIFAHRFAELYPDISYAYLNTDCYDKRKTLTVISTISKLANTISRHKNFREDNIAHYINKYNNVPIWVLVNHLDFGDIRHMILASTGVLQNKIAFDMYSFIKQHGIKGNTFPPEIMLSFIEGMNDVRNICAHNNRLIGFHCRRDSKYWSPLHSKYNIKPDDNRNSVYAVFISMQCFMSSIEYATAHNKMLKLVKKLDNRLHSISVNSILTELGFPADWHINTQKIQY